MPAVLTVPIRNGGMRGALADGFHTEEFVNWLAMLGALLDSGRGELIYRLRNKVHRLALPLSHEPGEVCVKRFAVPPLFRSIAYSVSADGTKAARAFAYAVHLHGNNVGVPRPVAFNEVWDGRRLADSFYLSEYLHDISDFNSEMAYLFREDPYCHKFMDLLRLVATEIRRMHDCGFVHQDLGGQNILLKRIETGGWTKPMFIDLNRGKILREVSLHHRARDLAKLEIPFQLRQAFFHFYFGDHPIPAEFARWESLHRLRITLHNESRKYRHPIRHLVHRRNYIVPSKAIPALPDMWLWDNKSLQPTVILGKRERIKFRARFDGFRMVGSQIRHVPSIGRRYLSIMSTAYQGRVGMRDRAGLCVEADAHNFPRMVERLQGMERIPIMIRCYSHRGRPGLEDSIAAVNELGARGHEVSLGIVQSRKSVIEPAGWSAYLEDVFAALHDRVRFVEIGHALNRVKWGVWSFAEAVRLYEPVDALRARYPAVKILGPAVNDFEFHYFPPLLARLPGVFDGVSSHLYVDRRGEPENPQGPFSLLEKCAMGRAVAGRFGVPGFYVTETNWPLTGPGEYSPVQGHVSYAGQAQSRLAVDEHTYAAYMVRYLLISLCSGFCERVWWWNLASRGFGLVDDGNGWRKRPGWHALAFFHSLLGPAVFERFEEREGARWFHFDRCSVAYARLPVEAVVPDGVTACHGLDGEPRALPASGRMQINGEPVYFVRESGGAGLSA